jgi:glutamate synthase (NADPH/NADH) small chain
MDDPYGFLRYPREEPGKEPASRRVRHWHEYVQLMCNGLVVRQASRCMDCGTPYCHEYCPVHNLIPDWNSLVSGTDWYCAWRQLDSTNNFPELTGRLCPAPCEDACTLTLSGRAVTIKSIELAIAERAWQEGWVQPKPAGHKRREGVAVAGSGPAGLACAQLLARVGYRVTVFEKADRVGGLLRYGIPDYRLQKTVLDQRLAQLEAEGVEFSTGVQVGADLTAESLRHQFDAVVLACGAGQPREVRVPGCGLRGIHYAMPYLTQQNHYIAGDVIEPDQRIDARGKDVVVIGGGDTGQDCVGTAIRQGARSVTQVQYHDSPPEQVDILDYWPQPAPLLRATDTGEEGCQHIWGYDTVAFDGHDGQVSGVWLQHLHWRKTADGHWEKYHADESPQQRDAQLVLIAIGFAHPVHDALLSDLALTLDMRGNVSASDADYQTSLEGVFSCGDMRRGQSLIVWAIREGRQCARSVDVFLSGDSELPQI